jgi:hypothetical protein
VELLGPYPHKGEYEHVFTIQRPDGSFLPLSSHVCDTIAQAVIFSQQFSQPERKAALREREERKNRQAASRDEAIAREALPPNCFYDPWVGYRGPVRIDPKAEPKAEPKTDPSLRSG